MQVDFPQLWSDFLNWIAENSIKLLIGILIFVIGWWITKFIIFSIKKGLTKLGVEKSVITFLTSFCKYLLRIFAFIIALIPFGFQVSSLWAALGAAGITLGFGLKESIANIASGIQIVITKPFQVGHYITLNTVEGTVTRVEIMYTTLMTLDKKEVVLPNSIVTNNILTNFTALGIRRVDFNLSVEYGTDISFVRTVLVELAKNNPLILDSPAPMVAVLNQTANGISITFRVHCEPKDYWDIFFSMHEEIKRAFELNHINIPFNQVDIYVKDTTKNVHTQAASTKLTEQKTPEKKDSNDITAG